MIQQALASLTNQEALSQEDAYAVMTRIMHGEATDAQIGAYLTALRILGESAEVIAGSARAMREACTRITPAAGLVVDTCGTGGDGSHTINISTAAALVAAGAGVAVAKHGNRTNTRASGSANVLAALGVNIECDAATQTRCLAEAGVCFSFAVKHHPAMKYAAPVRKQLGVRTIFNVLGPLTNPAGAKRQVMGVPSEAMTETIAGVLAALGAVRAMVVHSADGLDEISTTAPVAVAELIDGRITRRTVDAADLGLPRAKLDDLLIDSAGASATVIRDVLAGKAGPARDITAINAAAAIVVAASADDLPAGLAKAAESIDSGAASAALDKLIAISNE